jgi:hypothetical protein
MDIEDRIRKKSIARVAEIFRITPEEVRLGSTFGIDLKASFVSDFKDNELDVIHNDIHDVADKSTLAMLASEHLVVRCVADYCEHMVVCFNLKPKEVAYILSLDI